VQQIIKHKGTKAYKMFEKGKKAKQSQVESIIDRAIQRVVERILRGD